MTNSHSIFQGSSSDFLHNNRAKHPKLKYNRDFKRHMGPTLRYLLLFDPSGGVKQAPGAAPLAQSSTVCLLLVIPTNLRSQHIGINWFAFVCLGSFRHPSVCWTGRGSRNAEEVLAQGESRHLQPPFTAGASTSVCGTVKWHLGEKARGCVSAATTAGIHHFRGTNQCFPPHLSPLLWPSPRWGLSDSPQPMVPISQI